MSATPNVIIRDEARRAGVKLWQIADRLSLNDGNFSRKLRKELPDQEREKILRIIAELAQERQEAE